MPSGLQKRDKNDEVAALKSIARLRSRVLALLHAGREYAGISQVEIAAKLGVRKSAVNQVFNGVGNIHMDTLGAYLAAMGLEADLVVAELGEFREARAHRRAPVTIPLTIADHDRLNNGSILIVGYGTRASRNTVTSSRKPSVTVRNMRVQRTVDSKNPLPLNSGAQPWL